MRKCDLINSSHIKGPASKRMQVLDENSEVFFNFINSLHSDSTKKSYDFVWRIPESLRNRFIIIPKVTTTRHIQCHYKASC